ncbi:hypothetical protein BKA70DRAFT_1433905 [Coprinopsis sp. MPI-PUGE-AT-0042]|nr:hypothetical protein BKA70DRAFT_1433905 [Coprinopsis sp. MPI-PUGE-AT-0042]
MPHCHCVAHRCAGAEVDDSTLRRHQKASRRLLQQQVEQAGSKAVEAYEARIGQHLLEETLSNSNPPRRSQLWSRSPPQPFDLSRLQDALDDAASELPPSPLPSARTSASPPTHSTQVRGALDKMTGLESQIDLLTKSIASIRNAPPDDMDRLAPLNKSAAHISKQLLIISVKAPAITEMCSALQERLNAATDALKALEKDLAPKELLKRQVRKG